MFLAVASLGRPGGGDMSGADFDGLEVISRQPGAKVSLRNTPLLFLHGAYAAAWCWDEHFLSYFAERGYVSHALSFSGHGGSPGRERLDSLGIDHYVADAAAVAAQLPAPPVLVGHSMGGLVAQKYLEQHEAAGVVLLASVPPQGLWAAALGLAFQKPGLLGDLNRLLGGGRVALDTLRTAMFAQPVTTEDLASWYKRMQPESHRAIWDMTLFNLPLKSRMRLPPLLVLGAAHDSLIPPSQVEMTARHYGVTAEIFEDMGHGLMLEQGWRGVAERILAWLEAL
jgi:pimeloyl-ACP methyl ester carboxylesterase